MEHISLSPFNETILLMIDSQTFNHLKAIPEKEWLTIYKLLTIYAEVRLQRFGFQIRSEVDNVSGQDFAQQAIEKLFDGSRSWDYERFPDILIHLKGVVKSLISNHFKKSVRAAVIKKTTTTDNMVEDAEDLESATEAPDPENPEHILINDEQWKQLEGAFGEEEESFLIFYDWLDGRPPRDIAQDYGIDIKKIYNVIKKGRRFLKKILLNY